MFYNQNVKGVIFIVVYVDILLIVNFFVNLLLLQITCLVSKRSPKLYRIIISSCIGSLYSLIIFVDNLNAVLCELSKLIASAVMVLAAFGFRRVLVFVKQLLIFYFSMYRNVGSDFLQKVDANLTFFDIIILGKFYWREVVLCHQ